MSVACDYEYAGLGDAGPLCPEQAWHIVVLQDGREIRCYQCCSLHLEHYEQSGWPVKMTFNLRRRSKVRREQDKARLPSTSKEYIK